MVFHGYQSTEFFPHCQVTQLLVSRDGGFLVTAAADTNVHVYNLAESWTPTRPTLGISWGFLEVKPRKILGIFWWGFLEIKPSNIGDYGDFQRFYIGNRMERNGVIWCNMIYGKTWEIISRMEYMMAYARRRKWLVIRPADSYTKWTLPCPIMRMWWAYHGNRILGSKWLIWIDYLVGGLVAIFYFPIYWEYSSQLTFIFFGGVAQPPTRMMLWPLSSTWNNGNCKGEFVISDQKMVDLTPNKWGIFLRVSFAPPWRLHPQTWGSASAIVPVLVVCSNVN